MTDSLSIRTPSLTVRPLRLSDTLRLLELSQEECARRWLPSQVYQDEPHATAGIKYLIARFDLQTSPLTNAFVFGIEHRHSGRLIGRAGLSPLFGSVEVGFGIATPEQRKGYATEGVDAVCGWAFEHFSLEAILGVMDVENVPSQQVLIRCGFKPREKKSLRFQGIERPVVIYEIRKSWPNQRGGGDGGICVQAQIRARWPAAPHHDH